MKRRGQASIIGSILFFVLFAAAMAGVASYSSSQSQASGAANRAQSLNAQKGSEQLTYGALSSGALTIQNTGSSATSLVEVIIKYANGTVYTAAPSTSSLAANNLLQVGQLIPSTAAGSMTLQARYNAILSSTNSADQIGLVTSRGNTFWLKPAVAAATNPNLSYGVTFSASGASVFVSAAVLTVDGVSYTNSQLPVTLTWFTGTRHTYAWQTLPQGTGTRVGATTTGLTTTTSGTLTVTSPGTVQATYTTQYLLTLTGGSGVTTSPASPTGDGYYSSGTSVQATVPNAWGTVAGQSRSNLVSYSLDGSSPTSVTRSASGNFIYSLTMGAPHTVTFNAATQYYLTVVGGSGVSLSTASPTNDGWYDSGTTLTAASNNVWNQVNGQSRQNLVSWNLDGGANNAITQMASGTYTTSIITMSTYHTLNLNAVTQYYLTIGGGTSSSCASSQTSDCWFNSGSNAQAQSGYTWNQVNGQSRQNLYSWQVDSNTPNAISSRSGSGTYTSGNVLMNTYHTVTFNPATQYYLTVSGGTDLVYVNSQTNDGWYDSGTTIAQIQTDYNWNIVSGQSRQNLLSWNVDGGAPTSVTRSGSGTYTTSSIVMSTYHTVTFTSTAQYVLNAVGGNSVTFSGSVTSDGWFDSGSTGTATTNYVWGVVAGQSRSNLVSWNLDGGANQAVTRSGSYTYTTTSVTMNAFHTVNFNSVTQYYVTTATSIPSSGSVSALTISYSYQISSTSTSTLLSGWSGSSGSSQQTGSYTLSAGSTATFTASFSYSLSSTDQIQIGLNVCSGKTTPTSSPGPGSGTLSTSITCPSNSSGLYGWTANEWDVGNCGSIDIPKDCGSVSFSNGMVTVSVVSTSPFSGSTTSSTNSLSVSGTTVTYTYGVGYSFPGGSTSTSWSATWPSPESYSSNNCSGGSISSNTISGTGGSCTLTTTRTGTTPITLGASPTSDGWYDGGVSVALSTSPTGPFSFSSWSSSGGNLVVASTSSASTTVTPNTYGTVTCNFSVGQ